MKKTLWLFSILIAAILLVLSSCNGWGTDTKHTHTFGAWEETAKATCIKTGLRTRACPCGHTETEVLPLADHLPTATAEVSVDCVTDGVTGGTCCSICKKTLTRSTITPATGHTEVHDAAVSPTCTEAGLTGGSHCGVCNTVIRARVVIPPTHTYEASEQDGTVTYTCTIPGCDRSYTVPVKQDYHNVKDYGAVGDGITDDTVAFHDAIRAAERDGLPVYLPAGTYLVTQTLSLTSVTLYGYNMGSFTADYYDLPTVLHTNLDAPLFNVNTGSLSGIHINVIGVTENSTAAETIMVSGVGSRVHNVRIDHPYIGIKATYNNVGRSVFDNIFIVQAWNTGVDISGTLDIATLQNIEVWNNELDHPCPAAFRFGRNDSINASNLFTFNALIGFEFYHDRNNLGGCWGSFDNCDVDYTYTGILVGEGNHYLTFNNGSYWGRERGLYVSAETGPNTRVTMAGAEFRYLNGTPIHISGGQMITVTGCNALRLDKGRGSSTTIIEGGLGVTLVGNTFATNGPAVRVSRTFMGAANITGNTVLLSSTDESEAFIITTEFDPILHIADNIVLLGQTIK